MLGSIWIVPVLVKKTALEMVPGTTGAEPRVRVWEEEASALKKVRAEELESWPERAADWRMKLPARLALERPTFSREMAPLPWVWREPPEMVTVERVTSESARASIR